MSCLKCGDLDTDFKYLCSRCLLHTKKYLWCVIIESNSELFKDGEMFMVDPYIKKEITGNGRSPNNLPVDFKLFNSEELEQAVYTSIDVHNNVYIENFSNGLLIVNINMDNSNIIKHINIKNDKIHNHEV